MKQRLYSLFITIVGLTGCSSPPQSVNPVDSVCRSCQPHEVMGVWYYPQTHYDYEEEGKASWYGPGFHGRPKAYGEKYDQHGISAAHRTLPLPTVVEVTNIKNGKSRKLVVDDRGPYVDPENRIIDLSRGAAEELGTLNAGVGEVRVVALPEESKALSKYLGKFGRWGIDPSGRTWNAIYEEEIAPRFEGVQEAPSERKWAELQPVKAEQPEPQSLHKGEAVFIPTVEQSSRLDQIIEAVEKQPLPRTQMRKELKPRFLAKASTLPCYIEVGHYVHEKNAKSVLSRLMKIAKGEVRPFMASKRQQLYSVKLGPFPTSAHAKTTLQKVAAVGYEQAVLRQ